MQSKEKFSDYLFFLFKKLISLAAGILVINIAFLFLLNRFLFHLPPYIPLLILLLPLISFFLFYFKTKGNKDIGTLVTHCKYSFVFPFYFHSDSHPIKDKRFKIDDFKNSLKSCDILLRRYKRYIDGLIFSQNSYFTHAGIYCGNRYGYESKVLHCTGEHGVHADSLEDFCNCDDVAVLRFSFSKTDEEKKTRDYILQKLRKTDQEKSIQLNELEAFDSLMKKVKPGKHEKDSNSIDFDAEGCSNLILDRAISLENTPYDFKFNFENFETMSCVEYVWYCFKCLFPLHRIRVKDFEFFKFITMPVIVPDVFIKNDFFEFKYTSIPEVRTKKQLMKYTKKDSLNFWKFILSILAWDLLILYICHFILTSWLQIY